MILLQLGYERENLERSKPDDVAHACQPRDLTKGLCGLTIRTSFENILFGTLGTTQPGGTPKCAYCLDIARGLET